MSILIGVGLVIIGGVTAALLPNPISYIVMFIGVFLFASFPDDAIFCDYIIANSNEALVRKRYYIIFIPFLIISRVLTLILIIFRVITLEQATLKIVWKEEYFKLSIDSQGDNEPIKISRKEYIALRNEQRVIYSTQPLSKEFMENSYTVEDIGFKRKKRRLIIAVVFAALMLTMLVEPGVGIYLTLIYEAVFVPMVILWIPEYKDAKILHQAYERAQKNNQI